MDPPTLNEAFAYMQKAAADPVYYHGRVAAVVLQEMERLKAEMTFQQLQAGALAFVLGFIGASIFIQCLPH